MAERLFTMLEFAIVNCSGTDQNITPHTKKGVAQWQSIVTLFQAFQKHIST